MKALRVFFVCVALVPVFSLVGEVQAQQKWGGFFLATLGVHTLDGTAFRGFTGYLGGSKDGRGIGIMGSYEVGDKVIQGFDTDFQIINGYLSVSYTFGKSTFIISPGVSTVIGSTEGFRTHVVGFTSAVSYIFDPGKWLFLFGQVRLQGKGLMLSAGVGF